MNNYLKVISEEWKTEAANEKEEYFFNYDEVESIINGEKLYVIGRKGTGKTCISEHINSITESDVFTEKLSFKDFPFRLLYEFQDRNYPAQHRYITLWMQLIYMSVCKMLIKNQSIPDEIKNRLKKMYPYYMDGKLEDEIKRIKKFQVNFSGGAKGVNGGLGGSVEKEIVEGGGWIDDVDVLQELIREHCDECRYYIIFDQLDEDYSGITEDDLKNNYLPLLTGLFKAVQKVRNLLRNFKIYPIVFLRDDIYERIKDSDKNKWDDILIRLVWDNQKLKNMVAHRLAISMSVEDAGFELMWRRIVDEKCLSYPYGSRKVWINDRPVVKRKFIPLEDFFIRNSLMRPRDIVKFIVICCKIALSKGNEKIYRDDVKQAIVEYSHWFKREFDDEVQVVLPDMDVIWRILSDIKLQIFNKNDFYTAYGKYKSKLINQDASFVLEQLFEFSIIGNQDRANQKRFYFKYEHVDMKFNEDRPIVINPGLLKSLQIS